MTEWLREYSSSALEHVRAQREETILRLGSRRSQNAVILRNGANSTIKAICAELHRREMATLDDPNATAAALAFRPL